jgi:hypothetical protein
MATHEPRETRTRKQTGRVAADYAQRLGTDEVIDTKSQDYQPNVL